MITIDANRRLAGSSIAKVGVPAPPVLVTADDVAVGKPDPAPTRPNGSLLPP